MMAARTGIDRAKAVVSYEEKLQEARVWARIIAGVYFALQLLATCSVAWATTAIVGAFLSKLLAPDFVFVIILMLVEASRAPSLSDFKCLLAYAPSEDPGELHSRSRDGGHRFYSNVLQFIRMPTGFLFSYFGLNYGSAGTDVRNLQMSLHIFYSLVALNAVVTLFYLLCSLLAWMALRKTSEQSVVRYFDTVLESGMTSTLAQADDLAFFQFAYRLLGSELSQNVEPEAVAENYTMMIQYLYAHRRGVDFLEIYLDADDEFVQLAAANIVGSWADRTRNVGEPAPELRLPEVVLKKLAYKGSTRGQVGRAAITSFCTLGASSPKWARIVATTRTSSGMLPDHLAELFNASNASSLSLMTSLVGFYEQLCVNETTPPKPFGAEAEATLVARLKLLAREAEEHRIRVHAAYLLLLMQEKGWDEEVVVGRIEPRHYWFESELMMLELLRHHIGRAASLPLRLPPDPAAPINPPTWAVPSLSMGRPDPISPLEILMPCSLSTNSRPILARRAYLLLSSHFPFLLRYLQNYVHNV